jgi:threonine/homoserine/homoserine lactone efflux protein
MDCKEWAMTFEFLLTSLIVVASPGTGAIFTIATGLAKGARASVIAAFGCTLGIIPHMLAAITGLAALLHASAVAFDVLKYLGVAYLLYMAWSTLQEKGAMSIEPDGEQRTVSQVILHAIMINILNPKLTIFFFAFLPQFIGADAQNPLFQLSSLSAVFMVMTFVVFAIYGVLAAAVRNQVLSRPNVLAWMRRVFAGAFVALGAKLAVTER